MIHYRMLYVDMPRGTIYCFFESNQANYIIETQLKKAIFFYKSKLSAIFINITKSAKKEKRVPKNGTYPGR